MKKHFPWEVIKLLWWRVALYLSALALLLALLVIYVPPKFWWLGIPLGLLGIASPPFLFWTFVFIVEPYQRIVFPEEWAETERRIAEEQAKIEEELRAWRREREREDAWRRGENPKFKAKSDRERTEHLPPNPEPVEPAYSPEDLKTLYRLAARKHHPDLSIDDSDYARRERLMKEVNLAYEQENGAELERLVDQASE